MKSNNKCKKMYINIQSSKNMNALLSESCTRFNREKIPEAALSHKNKLKRFFSMSELNYKVSSNMDVNHDSSAHQ